MRTALVILENGSRWPAWLDQQELDSCELIAQRPGETPQQLARRVVERLSESGLPPQTATLACSPLGGHDRNQARAALLRALLGAAITARAGDVVLVADGSPELRRELARLAALLNREIHDEPTVSLRFRAQSRAAAAPYQRRVA